MADLRGQELRDSYQNVVTRGAGNKLDDGNGVEFADLDDKASLSGGADANFTLMPQVGGSPIIEKGSGSYYKWIKYANGSMIYVMERLFEDLSITNAEGNIFRSSTVTSLFLTEPFNSQPIIISMGKSTSSTIVGGELRGESVINDGDQASMRFWSSTSTAEDVIQRHILIGEWY